MLFNSPVFLFLFLPVLLVLYYLSPRGAKNAVLLLASLLFYAWGEGAYVLLLLASIVFNYAVGRAIGSSTSATRKRIALVVGVTGNIAALLYFKYANFIVDNLNEALHWSGSPSFALDPIHLPIGISFFVFQGISYVIDVHRGTAQAQSDLGKVALFKAFFPQLIAGPIVRYVDIKEQLTRRSVDLQKLVSGVERFIIGLFKKTIIANQCAIVADAIFDVPPESLSTPFLWLGAIAYSLQLYFDFSAYSDMAIGLARIFGLDFLENFNYPYVARSIQDFWRRWHISLSTWFRDYVYIPLGGNRLGPSRTYFNLFIVFFLTGLWHGASWNFIAWGLFHGCFLAGERAGLARILDRIPAFFAHSYTLVVVLVGWVFFRSVDMVQAFHYLGGMFIPRSGDATLQSHISFFQLTSENMLYLSLAVVFCTPIYRSSRAAMERSIVGSDPTLMPRVLTSANYVLLLTALVISLSYIGAGTYNPFIYFRF